jgi:hypothetical protein
MLSQDLELRKTVLERIAVAPGNWPSLLDRFSPNEAAIVSNQLIGKTKSESVSEAHHWLCDHPKNLDTAGLIKRIQQWPNMTPFQAGEVIHLLHLCAPSQILKEVATNVALYAAPGPKLPQHIYASLAEVAAEGLKTRLLETRETGKEEAQLDLAGPDAAGLQIMRTILLPDYPTNQQNTALTRFLLERSRFAPPEDRLTRREFAALAEQLAGKLLKDQKADVDLTKALAIICRWRAKHGKEQ